MAAQERVCLITGATSGIGLATAEGIAQQGFRLVLLARDAHKAKSVIENIKQKTGNQHIEMLDGDLASLRSIRSAVQEFNQRFPRLDILINNAAIVPAKRTATEDGFETQFAVNHLAPFLLTNLLLERLTASAPARVVVVASDVHHNTVMPWNDLQSTEKYSPIRAYKQSKLANVLFTYELARRLDGSGVTANCLHPGVVRSALGRDAPAPLSWILSIAKLFMLTPEKGAATSIHVATSPNVAGISGQYFDKCAVARSSSYSHNRDAAERLWSVSCEMVGSRH